MKKKVLIGLGVVFGLFLIFGISIYNQINRNTDYILSQTIEEVDFTPYADGVYEGEYYSEDVGIKVAVEVESGRVTSIHYENHLNGRGDKAETIDREILDEQSIIIDDVSGATTSSRCIKLAIMNAFEDVYNE